MEKNYKIILSFLIVASFFAGLLWLAQKHIASTRSIEVPTQEAQIIPLAITITQKTVTEENFTGTMPVISGSSDLAIAARTYVDQRIREFRTQANTDVPDIRKEFGQDSPSANYTIDIDAKYIKNEKTDSIVIDMYAYTGGANGNSAYKVFTASTSSGKTLSLADIILPDKQSAFTEFVKTKLKNWRPEGSTASVVFEEDINNLTFNSFSNWSLDQNTLTVYFDKYAIGPGALGAVAFPVPLLEIKRFLQ